MQVHWTIGELIRKARTDAGLEQADLAEAIGVSRVSVSNWERGIHSPSIDHYQAVARVCGARWLLTILAEDIQPRLHAIEGDTPQQLSFPRMFARLA